MPGSFDVVGVYEAPDAPEGTYLIELRGPVPARDLDLGAVTQEAPGEARDNWQAAWLERWLDPESGELVSEPFDDPPEELAQSRLVFFLHLLSWERPLLTPDGFADLPAASERPERLQAVAYEEP